MKEALCEATALSLSPLLLRGSHDAVCVIEARPDLGYLKIPVELFAGLVHCPPHVGFPLALEFGDSVLVEQGGPPLFVVRPGAEIGSRLTRQRSVYVSFVRRIEIGEQPIEIALLDRIVFVVVTLRAAHRDPEKNRSRRAYTVDKLIEPGLALIDARFAVRHRLPIKTGGDPIFGCRTRKFVARDLEGDETVIRQIAVIGVDDPVPITPGPGPYEVLLESV